MYVCWAGGWRWDAGGGDQSCPGSPFPELVLGEIAVSRGLTCVYPQGAYGVVRLAYNESEDRHYVSLGIGGRCCPVGP